MDGRHRGMRVSCGDLLDQVLPWDGRVHVELKLHSLGHAGNTCDMPTFVEDSTAAVNIGGLVRCNIKLWAVQASELAQLCGSEVSL